MALAGKVTWRSVDGAGGGVVAGLTAAEGAERVAKIVGGVGTGVGCRCSITSRCKVRSEGCSSARCSLLADTVIHSSHASLLVPRFSQTAFSYAFRVICAWRAFHSSICSLAVGAAAGT